jgi:signal transduction histidine kinase
MNAPAGAHRRQAVLVWLFGIGVVASIWIALAAFVRLDRRQQITEAWQATSALTSALAEQVDRAFAEADVLLRFVRLEVQHAPGADPFIAARSLGLITDAYTQVVVVDAAGTPLHFLLPPAVAPPQRMFADRDWLQATQAMRDDQIFIGKPVLGRVQGRWAINVARPILVDGEAKGAIVVALDPYWFARFFDRINLGPHGSAQIFDFDGQLLSRSRLSGEMLDGTRRLRRLQGIAAHQATGQLEVRSPIDGLDKLLSVQRLAHFPLGVSVAYGRDDVLQPVLARARFLAVSAAALTVLVLLATVRLHAGGVRQAQLVAAIEEETRQLRRTETRLSDVIETMPDGIAVWDADERLVLCNARYRTLFDPVGDRLVPPITWREWRAHVLASGLLGDEAQSSDAWRALPVSERRELSAEVRLTNGSWLLCHEVPTSDGGVLGLRIDITSLKAREIELSESRDLLRAKSEELGRLLREVEMAKRETDRAYEARGLLLTHISHELRTPMTAVIGFARLLQAQALGPLGDARYAEFADRIVANGEHQVAIINDVLDLARAEAGRLVLDEIELKVGALVDWVVAQMQPLADTAGIALQANTAPDLMIRGDEKRLRQVLLNLVSNSIKFSPGGLVAIEAEPAGGGGVLLRVRDTGRGIDPADLPRVMELFGQAHNGSGGEAGTGVGLPLVQRLIEAHGGRFELTSDGIGTGTTAQIYLPSMRPAGGANQAGFDRRAEEDRQRRAG